MDFVDENILHYAEVHTTPESDILKELNRETQAHVLNPRMLSGHLQGRVLSMLSHMIRPQFILEIGTFTGYSAICLCEGLQPHGKLITIDINEELEDMVRNYFNKGGLAHKAEQLIGDATKIIPTLQTNFDLVFIDADKINYSRYYDLVFDKVNNGGYLIADNVLWSGNVLNQQHKMDDDTKAIVAFNQKVQNDNRVENVLMPVRDGLMIVRKK